MAPPGMNPRLVFLLCSFACLLPVTCAAGSSPTERLHRLARASVERGGISYSELVAAFYGPDAGRLIAAKGAYRATHAAAEWVSDYDRLIDAPVTVRVGLPRRDGLGLVVAKYCPQTNTVTVESAAAGSDNLAHEVGHGLMRHTIRTEQQRNLVDHRILPGHAPSSPAQAEFCGFDPEWFNYFSRQCEIEVRMQALNRFYFAVCHAEIDSPASALRAIAALGVPLADADIAAILQANGTPVDPDELRSIRRTSHRDWASVREQFEDAFEIRTALTMASSWDAPLRRALLAKLALESPGHL